MRRVIVAGLGFALSLGTAAVAAAADPPQAIATNAPRQSAAATLGAPVAALGVPTPAPIRQVSSFQPATPSVPVVRAQQPEERPMPPVTPNPAPTSDDLKPLTPFPRPTLMPPGTITGVSPVPYAGPGCDCVPTPFDPSGSPLPGGVFEMASDGPRNRIYGSVEYLLWWIQDGGLPPLASTVNSPTPGVFTPGATLFGGSQDLDNRSGGRFSVGVWLGQCRNWAIEGNFFFLGNRATGFATTAGPDGTLGRPFINANTGAPDVEIITFPGIAQGAIAIDTSNSMLGAEINARRRGWNGWCGRVRIDGLVGFRYVNFEEDLKINETVTVAPGVTDPQGNPLGGVESSLGDRFEVNNDFYGGQLGALIEWRRGRFSFQVNPKVALGSTHQELRISGAQTVTAPATNDVVLPGGAILPAGQTATLNGGFLARPSNIGTFERDKFAVVPEIGVNVGYQFTPNVQFFVGYTFLYWSNVLRAGDQVDVVVNPNGTPLGPVGPGDPNRPTVLLKDTDIWAQGVNFGLRLTW